MKPNAWLWSDTIEKSVFQAANWLDICVRHGITLNPDKFKMTLNSQALKSPMTL